MINRILTLPPALALAILAWGADLAQAQVAEVPIANAKGDFTTARVLGNRGYYRNTRWLIVDASGSLNCRATPNGAVKKTLATGWIVTAAFPSKDGDAIVLNGGSPWLRVFPQEPWRKANAAACMIRANKQYIAPISEDFTK